MDNIIDTILTKIALTCGTIGYGTIHMVMEWDGQVMAGITGVHHSVTTLDGMDIYQVMVIMDGIKLILICTVEEAQEVKITPLYIPQTGDQLYLIVL